MTPLGAVVTDSEKPTPEPKPSKIAQPKVNSEPSFAVILAAITLANILYVKNNPEEKKMVTEFPLDNVLNDKDQNTPDKVDQSNKGVQKVVNGLNNVANCVKKKCAKNTSKKDHINSEKLTYSNVTKETAINTNNKTFNSHPNRSEIQTTSNLVDEKDPTFSTIMSPESNWDAITANQRKNDDNAAKKKEKEKSDGPLVFSMNPCKEILDQDKNVAVRNEYPLPPPRRIWDDEKRPNYPNCQITNSFPANSFPANSQPSFQSVSTAPRVQARQTNSEKPNTVREISCQLISTGDTGEEIVEEKSVYHDGFQVYRSSAYKR